MCGEKAAAKQALESFRQALNSNPTNLDAANRYWNALASSQSGGHVIEAYRRVALVSQEGVIAFARAYRELFKNSGEGPRAVFFDKDLLQTLQARLPKLPERDRSNVEWILQSLRCWP
jgi:hypothetical protein